MPSPELLIQRIDAALDQAAQVFSRFDRSKVSELTKSGGDPVTEADYALDRVLRETLLGPSEGWLSEETADDANRLERDLVWIVDPLDGTREFIDGLPEFCTSIAAVCNGQPLAGGILNPAADLRIVGAVGVGATVNGEPVKPASNQNVLASRSEWNRGTWEVVEASGLEVVPMGSVAYKFARVAAGLDFTTWTPVPKHEWDVAGGAALLLSIGGSALGLDGQALQFNQPRPWMPGAIAIPPWLGNRQESIEKLIAAQTA